MYNSKNIIENNIKYCKNECTQDMIYKHMLMTDENFIPKLSEQVNIKNFSQKIYEKADIFALLRENKIIAILACYNNDIKNKIAYITFGSVMKEHRRKGYATFLLKKAIAYSRKNGMKKIQGEIHKDNKINLKLAKKMNFKQIGVKEENIVMELILNE